MRIAFFDSHRFEKEAFTGANASYGHEVTYIEPRLTAETASLAAGHEAACSFVNDVLDAQALETLAQRGTRLIALRCAGFNHVNLEVAAALGLPIVRVPEYSPHAVAEHAVAMLLTLNRKLHRAANRVREGNFSLEGLVGFDLFEKVVGLVGLGRIGRVAARIFCGFGCRVLVHDFKPDEAFAREVGVEFVSLPTLYASADIISLHVPLTPQTLHLLDDAAFAAMKSGVIVINTGRGKLIDTRALVSALKIQKVGGACLDVYEEEESVFFQDLSGQVLQDDVLARLLTFPNVLITSHQAFLTREALRNIAETTLASVTAFERGEPLAHQVVR